MQRTTAVGLFWIASVSVAWAQSEGEIGAPLPAWMPGMLDIHQIATGRGKAALFIPPDGSTLLVDAGAAGDGIPETDPHPDASRTPGACIARYIERRLPPGVTDLDYALIAHFHVHHMGQLRASSPLEATGTTPCCLPPCCPNSR
jgi:glyoxylase-like metal-dependent hydrolase (beta-lactamase superfamily II)